MRLQLCNLNYYLYQKGCIDSPLCRCGHGPETTEHYFFNCDLYNLLRIELLSQISNAVPNMNIDAHLLLHGSPQLDNLLNNSIVDSVIEYLNHSGRFEW